MLAHVDLLANDSRKDNAAVVLAALISSAQFLGEALRRRPRMDNPALVEAMGSHFDPHLADGVRPQDAHDV
jgi:hypothetical protein